MKRFFPYIILTALVVIAYSNTLNHAFQYDDLTQILKKPWVRAMEKIPEFISNPSIRPVVILSFNLNHAISGFEVWSYHVFNILVHLGVVLMLYRLVLLTGKGTAGGADPPAFKRMALIAAALFALHPLNTQTVTYISSRSSSLSTLFYLITMELFFRGWLRWRADAGRFSARVLVLFAGALMALLLGGFSKLIIITIPALLFLYHFYFFSGQRFGLWLKRQSVPILAVAVPLFGIIAYRMMTPEGVLPTGKTHLSASQYLLTETFVIPFEYFKKMLWPVNLSIDIHFPVYYDWTHWLSYTGILTLVLFVLIVVRVSGKRPWIGFGLAWMGITILPTSSFVPLHDVAVEHRTYLPLIGFCFAAAAVVEEWVRFARSVRPGGEAWVLRGMGLVLALMAALLVDRNQVWETEIALWADAKKKAPYFIRPHNNLGEAYDKVGDYDNAIRVFKEALKLNPNYTYALNNLGNVYGKLQQYRLSLQYFQRVIELDPNYAPGFYNLGRAQQALNRLNEAMASYHKAFDLEPHFEEALYNYGMLAVRTFNGEEAVKTFRRFIEYYPGSYQGYFGLGNGLMVSKKPQEAISAFKKAAGIKPDYTLAYVNLAVAQMQSNKIDDAIETYEYLLKTSPSIAGVDLNLGMIYQQYRPNPEKALFHFQETLRKDPGQPQAALIQSAIDTLKQQLGRS